MNEDEIKQMLIDIVEDIPWAIRHIPNPDKDIQLAAVKVYPGAIKYIKNPDEDAKNVALERLIKREKI